MSRKVLIINLEFPPVGGPGVQRVLKFVRYLPEEGWTPTVICGDKSVWHDSRDYTLLREIPRDVDVFRISFSTIKEFSVLVATVACYVLLPLWPFIAKKQQISEMMQKAFPS